MKCHVFFPIALLLLTVVWVTACTGERTSMVPSDEAITVQTRSAGSTVVRDTVEKATGVRIVEPQQGDATMTPVPTAEATEVEPPARAKQVVRLALEDLARRMGVAPEAIQLVSVEAVEWSDASLGCPQPGMMYAQVITPGFRVVLKAKGQAYEYHTDTGRFAVLCRADGLSTEPVPLMPVAPHGVPGKPRMPAD